MADIRRRTNSDGSIGYQVRFIDKSKKSGFGYRSFAKAKHANQFKAEMELLESGLSQTTGIGTELTVPEAIELWLNICEKIGRDGREPVEVATLIEYRRRANVMLQFSWNEPISRITPTDIVQFRTWLLEHFSRDLARRTLSSFSSVLKEMGLQGHMLSNPASGISIRSSGRSDLYNAEVEIPSEREIRDILDATTALKNKGPRYAKAWARYRPMILLMIFAGPRMSEIRGLSWKNMFADSVKITQRADRFGTIGPVKSKAGYRTIELSSKVTDEIFEWQERCPASTHDLVFPTHTGKCLLRCNFDYDAWQPLMLEADLMKESVVRGAKRLRPKYTPHALRHFFASSLIEKGKDTKFIQDRMGHSSAEMTLDVYGHLMKDREDEHRLTADEFAGEFL